MRPPHNNGQNSLPADDELATEVAYNNNNNNINTRDEGSGPTGANRRNVVPKFLVPRPGETPPVSGNSSLVEPPPLGALTTAVTEFKEDELEDENFGSGGGQASPRTATEDGSPTAPEGRRVGTFGGPVRMRHVLAAIVLGSIFLCAVYVLVLLVLANTYGKEFADHVERDAFAVLFSGVDWAAGASQAGDWHQVEDAAYFQAVASPRAARYIRVVERAVTALAASTHGAVGSAAGAYQTMTNSAASTRVVNSSFWAALVAEGVLLPLLAGAFSTPSLLTASLISLPATGGSATVFVGLHSACALSSTATLFRSSCITMSFAANSTSAPAGFTANGTALGMLLGAELDDHAALKAELLSAGPALAGPTLAVRNGSVILLSSTAGGGSVASMFSLAGLGQIVVQAEASNCMLCTPIQLALLSSLQQLALEQSLVSLFALASPSVALAPAGSLSAFGRGWGALVVNNTADMTTLQVAAAANTSRTFADGPLTLLGSRILVTAVPLNMSFVQTSSAMRNPQNIHVLVAQRVSGALGARNRQMEQVLSSTSNLRVSVAWASVGLGLAYLALCLLLGSIVLCTVQQLGAGLAAIVENLHCARSMELEKATVFVAEQPHNSARSSPKHASSGSVSEDAWSISGPPRPKSMPMSMITEVRKVQEAMNAMLTSLRDYRKFLPSTLFLHGEVPLQEELAEELLLGTAEGPAASRPASFRVHSPASFSRGSPRGSPTKHSSFRGEGAVSRLSVGKISPQAASLKIAFPPNASPRGSRVTTIDEPAGEEPDSGGPVNKDKSIHEQGGNLLAFCLKRRRATILTASFVGFLRASQEDVGEAHRASQTFLQIVLSVVDRNGGIVLSLLPDKVVATWNAFRSDQAHELNGAMCAYELNRTLQAADEEFLFSEHQVAICVASGPVVAGNTGTVSERASVVHGDCVTLSNELLTLLIAINVRCAVTKPVADRLAPPLWSLPIDIITDEDDGVHEVFELRSGDEPAHIALVRKGFQAFVSQDYGAAKELLAEAVKTSIPRVEPNAMRLLKLSIMFSKLQTPYVRAVPAWQRFETDGGDGQMSDPSPKRKYKSEKRKSQLADEQLRLELMNLRNGPAPAPAPASARRSVPEKDALEHSGISPRPPGSPFAGAALSPGASRRRGSKNSPSDEPMQPNSARRLSAANRTPPASTLGIPAPFRPPVVEFRDKKDMVFRMSSYVLGRGAVGEVLMGMSESGGLVAIKTVPLPSFLKKQEGEEQNMSGLSEIQKRRLKRKGVNVNQNIEQDLDAMLNEVAMLSRLRHENIVGYLSSAIVDGKLLVVMEYISGGSLQSLISEFKSVPATTAKRYLRDTLKGLQYLHREDIVHRDIKPQNVLILIDGSCKLTDFGTSQRLSKLSSTSTMEGTPQYMSPEASKGRAEKASDVWSFGILMHQLLTGDLPWPDDGCFIPMRFLYRLGNDETMLPTLAEAQLAPEAQEIIRWCCCRDPAKRPTVTQLLEHPYFTAANLPTPMGMRGPKRRADRGRGSVPRASEDLNLSSTVGGGRSPVKSGKDGAQAAVTLFKYSAFAEGSPVSSPKVRTSRFEEDGVDEDGVAFEQPPPLAMDVPGLVVEAPDE